ncbi:unnamed protein product [Phytomonas sp. Hart1]|nr:unnamed protein product [Phytomonas sp. Hart1]|eukprot:CCW70419.1 unnamed protein product [Phytomonas sp. isolate Hart1]
MGRASKDKRDIYYRKAKEEGYRARSAYKLLQIHEEFNLLDPALITTGVVDLCAAPGSWSQVLAAKLLPPSPKEAREGEKRSRSEGEASPNEAPAGAIHQTSDTPGMGGEDGDFNASARARRRARPVIIAVDLQEMAPIEGVRILQGDITSAATARAIIDLLNPHDTAASSDDDAPNEEEKPKEAVKTERERAKRGFGESRAELVVCDGAPDVTGMHELDEYLQHHLLLAALNLSTFILRPGGSSVSKIFRGPNTGFLIAKCETFFREVRVVKPKSSRNASMEGFLVCQGFFIPEGYVPRFLTCARGETTLSAKLNPKEQEHEEQEEEEGLHGENNNLGVFMEAREALQGPDYVYATGLRPPAGVKMPENPPPCQHSSEEGGDVRSRVILPFLSCGDLSGYDADMCYDREEGVAVLSPVQPPLMAPYLSTMAV